MRLQMVIAERRSEIRAVWSEVFRDVDGASVVNSDAKALMSSPSVDVELMPGMFAHERYGGRPKIGEAKLLSTRGELGMPPWVVTVAPIFHLGLTPEEEIYIIVAKAFEAIKSFDWNGDKPAIRTLGVDLAFLNRPQGDCRAEAEAVRKAYLDQCAAGEA